MARQSIQNANASLYLNGTTGYMTSPVVPSPTGFSFGLWIKTGRVEPASASIYLSSNTTGFTDGFILSRPVGRGYIEFVVYNTTNIVISIKAEQVSTGGWTHIAATYLPSGACSIYRNGELAQTGTSTGTMTASSNLLHLGRRSYTPVFAGLSANNLVWHNTTTPWTAQQVQDLYNKGTIPTGATAVYPLDEGAGSIAYDTSGNGNDGTITSGTWSRDTPTKTRKLVNNNLVYNGDFEIAPVVNTGGNPALHQWLDGSQDGSASNAVFGWQYFNWAGTKQAYFDNTVKRSGSYSMKLSTLAVSSSVGIRINNQGTGTALNNIPCLPNTSYTLSGWMKTQVNGGAATSGAYLAVVETSGNKTTSVGGGGNTTKINITTDWTYYSTTFTTGSTARYLIPGMQLTGNDGAATLIMDAWFDDIQLYPTTAIARSTSVAPPRRDINNLVFNGSFDYAPTFTAVTTTASRFIDGTAGGTAVPTPHKWAVSYTSGSGFAASFDTTEKYSGSSSMKISTTATNSAVAAAYAIATTNIPLYQLIRISPSTSYTVTFKMKTTAVSGSGNGAYLRINQYDQSGAFISVATTTTQIPTTTGWTAYTATFTTAASASFVNVLCAISGNSGAATLIMDAWFDDITLTPTTPITRSVA